MRKSNETVHFYKVSGAGNHFVLLDVRNGLPPMGAAPLVRAFCMKAFSVGADGVIFLDESAVADFRVTYYNADGRQASMCGNALRCTARFARQELRGGTRVLIETACGVREARVKRDSVEVEMGRPRGLRRNFRVSLPRRAIVGDVVDTGVPHFVTRVRSWKSLDVESVGRQIRSHSAFRPDGINVDFVVREAHDSFLIRTYERGVEAETLACGTGAVAAAVCLAARGLAEPPVKLRTRGGDSLTVRFEDRANPLSHMRLEGPAQVIYEGKIALSTLRGISRRSRTRR